MGNDMISKTLTIKGIRPDYLHAHGYLHVLSIHCNTRGNPP
jgi:hypothetical protein